MTEQANAQDRVDTEEKSEHAKTGGEDNEEEDADEEQTTADEPEYKVGK